MRNRAAGPLAGGAHGVEVYTRVTLYLFVLLEPFFYLYAVAAVSEVEAPMPGPGASVALVLLALAHMLACLAAVHAGFEGRPVTDRRSRRLGAILLLATGAVVVVAAVTLPGAAADGRQADPRALVIAVCLAATVGALAVTLSLRRVVQVGLVVPAAVAAVSLTGDNVVGAGVVATAVAAYAFTMFWAGTIRMSMWVVEVVRELDAAREVSARLAVAEERLRISRDMHDVVGRALSAVAVKSELAAALARRGDPRGADEMDDVRTLAQDSLREVRGVVAGYRAADLTTELDGARSVLRAAGVAVRVVGDVPALATSQADALAWVVREAVTNIVRHSAARECRIDLDGSAETGETMLRVSNDGVRPSPAGIAGLEGGNGLAGLRERLAAVGGTLDVATEADRFVLTARVPARGDAGA